MSEIGNKQFKNGEKFEEQLVGMLLQDNEFAQQMVEVLKPKYFTMKHLNTITSDLFAWYEKHKSLPSAGLFGDDILSRCDDEAQKHRLQKFFKALPTPKIGDQALIRDRALKFCRMNHLLLALEECLGFTEEESYDQIVTTINKAVAAGSEHNFGHIYKDELEERMREANRKPVATPWRVLNEITRGGLSAGELGVILALTGVGKSHALVDIGAAAAEAGLNVVHFTFELAEVGVGKRYDARMSGIAHDDLPNHREQVEAAIANLKGSVRIKKYMNRNASVQTLRNYVQRLSADNIKVDMLVVDYADIMKSSRSYENKRFEEEAIYEELRGLAEELEVPIWTASQVNRSGMDVEVLTLKHIAECFAKANIADLFLTMNRSKRGDYEKMKAGNYETLGNMYVAKSRLGPDGVKFNILVNTALSMIKCLEPNSSEEEQVLIQHDLHLETDAQRIRKRMTGIRMDGPAPLALVPKQEKDNESER